MPFCGDLIHYKIDQRLNFASLDQMALQQLTQFNNSLPEDLPAECNLYRKVLTCALAFPLCSDTPYVNFPCKDICVAYYEACGATKEDLVSCNAFPSGDCAPLSLFVAKESAGSILLPSFVLSLLLGASLLI